MSLVSAGILNTAAGSKLYIGSSIASQPNPQLDSYTEVGDISNLGTLGRVYELITFKTLGDRNVLKFKGPRDHGNMSIELGKVGSDAGQALAITALDDDHDYNFKVTLNDNNTSTGMNTTYYFSGKVMSFPVTIGTPNNVVTVKMDLQVKSNTIVEVGAT